MQSIAIDLIDVPDDRLRLPDPDAVAAIALSMDERGLMHPITVAAPKKGDRFRLIAGLHRLSAARLLGWSEIAASMFAGKGLEARLLEIDENLFHRPLSPLDRAAHLAERKRIYEELYPETRGGAAGGIARWYANEKISFASETAERLGISERLVQLAVARHTKIAPDVRAQIALTWVADKGTELDALARLEPAEQRRVIRALLSDDKDRPRNVAAATALLRGTRATPPAADDMAFKALLSAWDRAPKRVRDRFVDHLVAQGEVSETLRTKDAAA